MNRQSWMKLLDRIAVPLEEWEWEVFGSKCENIPYPYLRKPIKPKSPEYSEPFCESDEREITKSSKLIIYVRSHNCNERTSLKTFTAEIVDISDENMLIGYWRTYSSPGLVSGGNKTWYGESGYYRARYEYEHAFGVAWEDIIAFENDVLVRYKVEKHNE